MRVLGLHGVKGLASIGFLLGAPALEQAKHTGETTAIFCARLRLVPGVLQFLRGGSYALYALGNLAHSSSSPSSLAVTHTVSGCCWRCTGLDSSDGGFWKIPHFYVHERLA